MFLVAAVIFRAGKDLSFPNEPRAFSLIELSLMGEKEKYLFFRNNRHKKSSKQDSRFKQQTTSNVHYYYYPFQRNTMIVYHLNRKIAFFLLCCSLCQGGDLGVRGDDASDEDANPHQHNIFQSHSGTISVNRKCVTLNQSIRVSWNYNTPANGDWIGIYPVSEEALYTFFDVCVVDD